MADKTTIITRQKSGSERRREISKTLEEIVNTQLDKLKVQSSQHLLDSSEVNLLKVLISSLPVLDLPDEEPQKPALVRSKESLLAIAQTPKKS